MIKNLGNVRICAGLASDGNSVGYKISFDDVFIDMSSDGVTLSMTGFGYRVSNYSSGDSSWMLYTEDHYTPMNGEKNTSAARGGKFMGLLSFVENKTHSTKSTGNSTLTINGEKVRYVKDLGFIKNNHVMDISNIFVIGKNKLIAMNDEEEFTIRIMDEELAPNSWKTITVSHDNLIVDVPKEGVIRYKGGVLEEELASGEVLKIMPVLPTLTELVTGLSS